MITDHGAEQLAGDRWALTTLVRDEAVVDVLRARGLKVEILLDGEQVRARSERIAREVGDAHLGCGASRSRSSCRRWRAG
jgi:hypothetical protein